jgi:hypothetical protein
MVEYKILYHDLIKPKLPRNWCVTATSCRHTISGRSRRTFPAFTGTLKKAAAATFFATEKTCWSFETTATRRHAVRR